MNKQLEIHDLTKYLAARSTCSVKVGAVIYDDDFRILSWGWNHSGSNGFGECAERYAIRRSNRKRLNGSTICIVSIRRNKMITSLPCMKCAAAIKRAKIKFVEAQHIDGLRRVFSV